MTRTPLLRALTSCALAAILLAGCSDSPSDDPANNGAPDVANPVEPAATVCDESLGAVDLPGDLLVPRDTTCRLEGTTVAGRVTVASGASLIVKDARFGEGISAHGFDRIVLRGGRAEGRPRNWYYDDLEESSNAVDFIFDGGRNLIIEDGPINGAYYILDSTGRVEVSRLYLDLGSVYCAGNKRKPEVSRISSENFGSLQGQCAGMKGFGQTDF